MKSDERILGDGDFVELVLSEGEEAFERYYAARHRGNDLDRVARRAAAVCAVEIGGIFSGSKQKTNVKARRLFCYWASSALGISQTELAGRTGISVPGVDYCIERGKRIARDNDERLAE